MLKKQANLPDVLPVFLSSGQIQWAFLIRPNRKIRLKYYFNTNTSVPSTFLAYNFLYTFQQCRIFA
jgi:hypothetical protein